MTIIGIDRKEVDTVGLFGKKKAVVMDIPNVGAVHEAPDVEKRRLEEEWRQEAQELAGQIAPHINARIQAVIDGRFMNWYFHRFRKDHWKMLQICALHDGTVIVRARGLPFLEEALGDMYRPHGYSVETGKNTCDDNSYDILIKPA